MALAVELGDGVKLELSCRTGSEYIVRTGLHTIFFLNKRTCYKVATY